MGALHAWLLMCLSEAIFETVAGKKSATITKYCTKVEDTEAPPRWRCQPDYAYDSAAAACDALAGKTIQRRRVIQKISRCTDGSKARRRYTLRYDCEDRTGASENCDATGPNRLYQHDGIVQDSDISSAIMFLLALAISLPLTSVLGVIVVRKCGRSRSYNDEELLAVEAFME